MKALADNKLEVAKKTRFVLDKENIFLLFPQYFLMASFQWSIKTWVCLVKDHIENENQYPLRYRECLIEQNIIHLNL